MTEAVFVMMKLKIGLIFIALTLTFNLYARFAGVTYDGVQYFINIDQGWAAVDEPSFSWEKYAGNIKVRAYVWETGVPNKAYDVVKIMPSAFADSPDLISVELPSTLTSIGDNAFYNCPKLESVNIPEGVKYIGDNAFRTTRVKPKLPSTLTTIGDRAFSYAGGSFFLTIPENVKEIGDYAFEGNDIYYIRFNAVSCNKQIGKNPFYGNPFLFDITFSDDVKVIPDYAFQNTPISHIQTKRNGETLIGDFPFSLDYLGIGAFSGCSELSEINTSSSKISKILTGTFRGCSDLRYVNISNIETIAPAAFYNCDNLSMLELGENLSSIASDSFGGSTNVRKTIWTAVDPITTAKYIPSEISIVPNDKYNSVGIRNEIMIYPNLKQRFNINGVTYVPKNGAERLVDIIGCSYDKAVRDIAISDSEIQYNNITFSIDNILPYAFAGNYRLTNVSVTIPVKVQTGWFQNCDGLKSAEIPVTTDLISDELFMNTALEKFTCPEAVTSIGNKAFYGCTSLSEISLIDMIKSIGISAFEDCSSLTEMKLPKSVELIKNRAFFNCSGLQTFEGIGNLTQIENEVFNNCNNLTDISLGHQMTSIGKDSFRGCEKIAELYSYAVIPPAIESSAFNDIDKWNCTLHIPKNSFESYSTCGGWKDFFKIENDLDAIDTSVHDLRINQDSNIKVFGLDGNFVFEGSFAQFQKSMEFLPRGIYIINSGTTAKKIKIV